MYDAAVTLEMATRAAVRKLRNLDIAAILALLRAEVVFDTHTPETAKALQLLNDAGIRFCWQYARLSTTELTKILSLEQRMRHVRYTMAMRYGVLPDTTLTETDLRDILERPRNLYAVSHAARKWLECSLGSDDAKALFGEHHVSDHDRMRIESLLNDVSKATIGEMAVNWKVVIHMLQSPERGFFVTDRHIEDLKVHGTVDKRLERMLAALGLWAPLVWTDEERAARHLAESDRVRMIAFQAQE